MSEEKESRIRFIDTELRRIEMMDGNVIISYPLNVIPDDLFQELLNLVEKKPEGDVADIIHGSSVHQPAVSTQDPTSPFPINSANKRVRLTLHDVEIPDVIEDLEGQILALQGKTLEETFLERQEIYRNIYLDDSKINRFRLGIVEMYGGTTYRNIRRDPRVTLMFDWYRHKEPRNIGIQLNCVAEIVPPGDDFYRFMTLMLYLFGRRYLDLRQTTYPCAYKLWISEVKMKSLTHREGFY